MSKKPKETMLEQQLRDVEAQLKGCRLSSEKFSKVFYSSPVMMALTEPETGRLIEVNESFCTTLEYLREELIGRTTLELNMWVHPEKRDDFVKLTDSGSESKIMEIKTRKKSGNILVGLFFTETLILDSKRYILSTIIDITKQKEAEKSLSESEHRYQQLVELLPVAMLVHCDGNIVFINGEAVELLHGSSPGDFIGKPILNILHPDYHEIGSKRIKDLYERKKGAELIEEKFICLDGEVIDVEVAARSVSYRGKAASQAVIIDITERKLIEAERQKALKLESLGILAGGIAHDFNNILTGIMGSISLSLLKTEPESKLHSLLQAGEKACMRARELTQQLLTFSRGGDPIKQNASIAGLIRESANFILRGSNVTCMYSFADDLLPVEVDKGQISQVIQNLIINADQAMPEGGVIEVTAHNVSLEDGEVSLLKKGKYVKIELKDEGIGIDEQFHQKVFDPYFTTKSKGSGLGLSVVYSIINKHHGAITVNSEMGEGTTFTFYLPASAKKTGPRQAAEEKSNGNKMTPASILIMDDDPQVRDIGRLMVESMGHTAVCVEDGKAAVALYKKEKQAGRPFDLAIMDLTVPGGMGGKQAVKELQAFAPEAKVVVASGYSNDPVMANYKKYGFAGVIPKPMVLKDLEKLLAQLLQ